MITGNENMCTSCHAGYTARPLFRTANYGPENINIDLVVCIENERPPISGGSIAGIVIGVFVAALIVCGVVFFLINKNKGKKTSIPAVEPKEVEMEEATA